MHYLALAKQQILEPNALNSTLWYPKTITVELFAPPEFSDYPWG